MISQVEAQFQTVKVLLCMSIEQQQSTGWQEVEIFSVEAYKFLECLNFLQLHFLSDLMAFSLSLATKPKW